ncbi:MAG TPA: cation-transporting ATPase [Cytophagales bacterium]|nr:cation-transporting ATPase [Cytophagales bacterium]
MKTKNISILFISILLSLQAVAQSSTVTAKIKVYGNCTMCKSRIESVLDHKGIKKATWDTKTKELVVVYNKEKITEDQIHQLVASAGLSADAAQGKSLTEIAAAKFARDTNPNH